MTDTGLRRLSSTAVTTTVENGPGIVWVDLGHEERDGMRMLTELLEVQPADFEDCFNRMPVPKLNAYNDHYFRLSDPLCG